MILFLEVNRTGCNIMPRVPRLCSGENIRVGWELKIVRWQNVYGPGVVTSMEVSNDFKWI